MAQDGGVQDYSGVDEDEEDKGKAADGVAEAVLDVLQ